MRKIVGCCGYNWLRKGRRLASTSVGIEIKVVSTHVHLGIMRRGKGKSLTLA
jgi:hypothetical protein